MDYSNPNQNSYDNFANNNQGQPYYNNLYNMFGGYNPILDKEAASLRKLGNLAGMGFLFFVVGQNIVAIILKMFNLVEAYQSDFTVLGAVEVFAPLIYVLLPFLIVFLFYSKNERANVLKYYKPESTSLFVLAIFAGLMICFVSDFASSFLLGAFSVVGVDFLSGMEDFPMPTDVLGYILMVIGTAAVPALLEEFAFRGVILQPLRRHGDTFAILMSSLLFALMHGNMVQIPFAFTVGLALGYFTITTGSIWTSVIIHFVNNLTSVVFSIYFERNPDASELPYYIISACFIILGVVALIKFKCENSYKLVKKTTGFNKKTMRGLYICTPTFVMSILYTIYTSVILQDSPSVSGAFVLSAILIIVCVLIVSAINSINRDSRISNSKAYSVSKGIAIVAAIFGTIFIFAYSVFTNIAQNGLTLGN